MVNSPRPNHPLSCMTRIRSFSVWQLLSWQALPACDCTVVHGAHRQVPRKSKLEGGKAAHWRGWWPCCVAGQGTTALAAAQIFSHHSQPTTLIRQISKKGKLCAGPPARTCVTCAMASAGSQRHTAHCQPDMQRTCGTALVTYMMAQLPQTTSIVMLEQGRCTCFTCLHNNVTNNAGKCYVALMTGKQKLHNPTPVPTHMP